MKTYFVNERFHTWQGEGVYMGKAAFFVRLHGCPLGCEWCDSAGTWHPDYVPKDVERMEPEAIAKGALYSGALICVVTGGEPCIHDLNPLTTALHTHGLRTHLETSGAFEITGQWDWVTVSPKDFTVQGKPMLMTSAQRAREFKIIVDDSNVPQKWLNRFMKEPLLESSTPAQTGAVWLHPEWSRRDDPIILSSISEAVKAYPDLFRAGIQAHKYYKVDQADNRSRPAVPLGGNPSKGF